MLEGATFQVLSLGVRVRVQRQADTSRVMFPHLKGLVCVPVLVVIACTVGVIFCM